MRAFKLAIIALALFVIWQLFGPEPLPGSAAEISPGNEVVMFTAPWCGYCDQARAHMNRKQVEFLEIDIESSVEANDAWRDAGGRGVPLTFIGDQRLAGYSAQAYDQALDAL